MSEPAPSDYEQMWDRAMSYAIFSFPFTAVGFIVCVIWAARWIFVPALLGIAAAWTGQPPQPAAGG